MRFMLNSLQGLWCVDDFSCKVTLTRWIRNQVTGSGFIRWLQLSWQTARWAGRTNGHWFFNKGSEAVSQPGYGDILSHEGGLLLMMPWLAPDHRPPHNPLVPILALPYGPAVVLIGDYLKVHLKQIWRPDMVFSEKLMGWRLHACTVFKQSVYKKV